MAELNPSGWGSRVRIGIYGGTFNPPHLGHLILAAEVYHQLKLSKILWVLTPDPPHKQDLQLLAWEDRLKLLKAAISGNPAFGISRVDINRAGPHYTVDTVRMLKQAYPDAEIVYLLGGDSFHDLPNWRKPVDFIQACDGIGVMRRPGDHLDLATLEEMFPGLAEKTEFVDAPLLEISSQQIRNRVEEGRPYRYYLPSRVYELINKLGLYTSDRTISTANK